MRLRAWGVLPIALVTVLGGAGIAGASLPTGVTDVTVTQGGTAANIDGHLHPASFISGTIRTSAHQPVSGSVAAYVNGRFAAIQAAMDQVTAG